MNKILLVFALIVGALAWGHFHGRLSTSDSASVEPFKPKHDLCQEKKFCIVVYVAPWCPACNSMVPRYRSAISKVVGKDYGIRFIVGAGETEKHNQAMANKIGESTFTDPDGSVHKKLNVSYYPSYFVLDAEQSVILSGDEAYQWASERI